MQPGASAVAASPVAAGGDELPSMVLAAYQDTAADLIPSVLAQNSVPLTDARAVAIDVTWDDIAIAASITAIAVTVQ